MVNRPKDQGTRFETRIVRLLQEAGLYARRLPEGGCLADAFRPSDKLQQAISRETDGWCTDLTIEFTPTVGGDYFIHVSARGSDVRS